MSSQLLELLTNKPGNLLLADGNVKDAFLAAVKESLDPIASRYSIFDQVHTDGLDAEQVWAQARMVVDGVVDKLLGEEIPPLLKRKREDEDEEDDESLEESLSGSDLETMDMDDEDDFEEEDDEEEKEGDDEEESGEDDDLKKPKTNELDDGFFRIEDFKKQILAMENDEFMNQDDDEEDEEVDFFADPDAEEEEDDLENIKYDDFFARAKKNHKNNKFNKSKRVQFKAEPEVKNIESESDEEKQYADAMDSMEKELQESKKDLFDSDEEDAEGSTENLSTFEKQQKAIMQQIRELERENIGEKHWTVKGEAKGSQREKDSLLEADLDFERSSKPVPVITQEITESLEDMIRRRIATYNFDDLPRRLPDTLPEFRKSRDVEVQETKSQKSLAELYEDDIARANGEYKDEKDAKLEEAHKEIIEMYNSISHKLDALCSWNYTPKAPKPSISIVANTSAISMEDAQPTAMATESMLAPQEVYTPGADKAKGEVIGRNGMPIAKAEMSREEKKRERRRTKAKKAKLAAEREETEKSRAQKKGSKADIMQTLKKGNVTVIGKQGEKRDLSGKLKVDHGRKGASHLKL
ncbi:U3 small nucleolar RNA-associated protein Mpp10p [Trichomonascus vanleenenianus]|uniref:rRNA-processing protein MPP10 n=1 Tax=Trichomonascus vanleenenianus TaxID=2268995 RepID=UPI003ECB1300